MANSKDKIIIGNCSGFYGDRLSAAKDMVEGGPIDVLTGDYLAELTMTILYNQKMNRGEDQGYDLPRKKYKNSHQCRRPKSLLYGK
jgi:hypothetical protein